MKSQFVANILSIFPEMFPGILGYSLAGKALSQGIWSLNLIDIKDFGNTKHLNVDDEQYGGGHGLVMRPDVVGRAIDRVLCGEQKKIYYFSPRGKTLNQRLVEQVIKEKEINILCGRFEGLDERVIDEYNVEQISIGDFILSGGEPAAIVLLDACVRLLPGVLSNPDTLIEESFSNSGITKGLLEYPLYTRPNEWRNRKVPDVLLSGNHNAIEMWRIEQAEKITQSCRPDMWTKYINDKNIVEK
jgi:tRNA (guanine37-N1)-methyltransferase